MTRKQSARRLFVYKAADGWRWKLLSAGRIVAESGEAYTRRPDALKAARNVWEKPYPIVLVTHTRFDETDKAYRVEFTEELLDRPVGPPF